MSILVTWRAGEEGGMSWSRSFPDAADALSVKVSTDPRISCCLQSPPFRQLFSLSLAGGLYARWLAGAHATRATTGLTCTRKLYSMDLSVTTCAKNMRGRYLGTATSGLDTG